MHNELNPGPLQKKPIYLLTCLPAISVISGLVSHTGNIKLLSTSYADTRHVGFCGFYLRWIMSIIDFLIGLFFSFFFFLFHNTIIKPILIVYTEKTNHGRGISLVSLACASSETHNRQDIFFLQFVLIFLWQLEWNISLRIYEHKKQANGQLIQCHEFQQQKFVEWRKVA